MDFIRLAWGRLRQKRHREKRGLIFATSPLTPITTVRLIKNCLIQTLSRFTCCYDYAQFPPPAYNFEIGLFVSLPSSRIKAITSLKCIFSFQFYNNTSFAKQLIKITWLYVTFFFLHCNEFNIEKGYTLQYHSLALQRRHASLLF